ncbi:Probable transposable element [Penicillium roqueforti FM164]|uniref:Str. FM013 n=2 Tax=Penicillium TaxID=5073 RepID=A0A0G4NZ87_PENC3|nr:Probable transposable element [Penicillium roqueforti FM164]CRL19385.1 unnamed protein product [Penicillium camemberti]
MKRLRRNGTHTKIRWIPTSDDNKLRGLAKEQARAATKEDALPQERVPRMKPTTLNIARLQGISSDKLPVNAGRHAKQKEANVLAQLRTGMAGINGYLHQINVADTDQRACGQARETVEHFLSRCQKWTAHWTEFL